MFLSVIAVSGRDLRNGQHGRSSDRSRLLIVSGYLVSTSRRRLSIFASRSRAACQLASGRGGSGSATCQPSMPDTGGHLGGVRPRITRVIQLCEHTERWRACDRVWPRLAEWPASVTLHLVTDERRLADRSVVDLLPDRLLVVLLPVGAWHRDGPARPCPHRSGRGGPDSGADGDAGFEFDG